jgi:replicative DNA helicase
MSGQVPDRLPAHSPEAEMSLIGSILVDSNCLYELRGKYRVVPELFYDPRHSLVLAACYALVDSGRPVDMLTVQQWLSDTGKLDQVGGASALVQYVDAVPTAAHVRHYAEIVRQKARLRRFVNVCREALEGAYYDQDIDKVMSKTANNLHDLAADDIIQERSNLDVLDEQIVQWEEAHARRVAGDLVTLRGLSTPYGRLNELLCGLQPGLHFIAAPPNAGKTCVEGQLSEHVASAHGPVLRIYLDDTHDDAMGRSASRIGGVSLAKLQHGYATGNDLKKIRDEVRPVIEAMPMYIREDVESVEQIAVLARLYKAKYGIVMLTVDYVQIVETEDEVRMMMERERLAKVCKSLKRLWKELRIPILVLSQVQREGYKGESNPRQASMGDLFGGAVLEQTASSVSILKMLKEDDIAPQPLDQTNYSFKYAVAWHLVKSKHGPKGMIPLWFYPKYFQFRTTHKFVKSDGKMKNVYWETWEKDMERDRNAGGSYEE